MLAPRLQAFLRVSVAGRSLTERVDPFDCFFHASDPLPNLNYAVPARTPRREEVDAALPALEVAFRERGRVPRFEFVGSYAPDLGSALEAAGYVAEPRTVAMTCVPDTLLQPPLPPGARIEMAGPATTDAVLTGLIGMRSRAFGAPDRSADPGAVAELRASWRSFSLALVSFGERVAGCASLTSEHDGIAELAGVAVEAEFRRRGIGGAMAAFLTARAFAAGVACVFLTAGDRAAARVYERAGFAPSPHGVLEYRKET